jgi:hypothetical protein
VSGLHSAPSRRDTNDAVTACAPPWSSVHRNSSLCPEDEARRRSGSEPHGRAARACGDTGTSQSVASPR